MKIGDPNPVRRLAEYIADREAEHIEREIIRQTPVGRDPRDYRWSLIKPSDEAHITASKRYKHIHPLVVRTP